MILKKYISKNRKLTEKRVFCIKFKKSHCYILQYNKLICINTIFTYIISRELHTHVFENHSIELTY